MKPKLEEFNYIRVKPVKIVKKDKIIRPFVQRGLHQAQVGKALSGKYRGEYIIYQAHTERKFFYDDNDFRFVPVDAVLSLVDIEDNEEIISRIEIKQNYNDPGWIDAVDH